MDRRILYAGLLVAAAGVGLVRAFRGPRIKPGKTRLLLVGDSLAVGLTPPVRALAADAKVPFESQAASGFRIDQWARSKKLEERLASFKPTMALVSLGTNDAYATGPTVVQQTAAALETLLGKLRRSGAEVVWIGPPKLPGAKTPAVLGMLKQVIPSSHYFPSERLGIPKAPDGIHSTPKGYAGWAGAIWRWLS